MALLVSALGATANLNELHEAGKDANMLEQPQEPFKASFEPMLSDRIKQTEDFTNWAKLYKISFDLEEMAVFIPDNPENEHTITAFYRSILEINFLVDSYKEKLIKNAKERFDEKIIAFNYACKSMLLSTLLLPYASSLWMKRKKGIKPIALV